MIHSPLHSYILAEGFGLYFIIFSIILLSRENYYRQRMAESIEYPSLLTCSLSLFISILLVLIHNLWVPDPRVIVTIICWIFLTRNILLIACPERMAMIVRKMCQGRSYYVWLGSLSIFGILLLTRGSYLMMFYQLHHS